MIYKRDALGMDHILEMIAKFAIPVYSDFYFTHAGPKANVGGFFVIG